MGACSKFSRENRLSKRKHFLVFIVCISLCYSCENKEQLFGKSVYVKYWYHNAIGDFIK